MKSLKGVIDCMYEQEIRAYLKHLLGYSCSLHKRIFLDTADRYKREEVEAYMVCLLVHVSCVCRRVS